MILGCIGRSTEIKLFHSTLDAINYKFRLPGVPLDEEIEFPRVADEFCTSLPESSLIWGCIGALDGISIKICKPNDKNFSGDY